MKKLTLMAPLFLFFLSALASNLAAQERDPIEMAKAFPPEYLVDNEIALTQITWRLKQLAQISDREAESNLRQKLQLKQNRLDVEALTKKLPIELQFANEEVRADLVGACLRELLAVRLDIAAREETIAQLSLELEKTKTERKEGDLNSMRKHKQDITISILKRKLDMIRKEADQIAQLHAKGNLSTKELERTKYEVQLAEAELETALIETNIDNATQANELAQRLIDTRIELQPLKARAAAAEKFLNMISGADPIVQTISARNAEIEMDLAHINESMKKLWHIEGQKLELEALFDVTKTAMEKLKEAKPAKDESK